MNREVISLKFKFGKIIFIFALLAAMLAAPVPGLNGQNTSDGSASLQDITLSGVVDHPPKVEGLNATAFVNRTVAIRINSEIVLQDDITVTIKDNKTSIGMINYTIPTVFQKDVQSVRVWVQYSSFLDIQNQDFRRGFEVYKGLEATTYYIDVSNNSKPITDNVTKKIYIRTELTAVNHIRFSLDEFEQRAEFITPVTPLLSNINTTGRVEIGLESQQDRFSSDSTGDYQLNNNSLIYNNLESNGYDRDKGLVEDVDYATVVFKSTTDFEAGGFSITIPFVFEQVNRRVIIDPYGYVYVREEVTLRHLGAPKPKNSPSYIRSFGIGGTQLSVPGSATVTNVYDVEGSLNLKDRDTDTGFPKTDSLPDGSFKGLKIAFRNTIYGGEKYTFIVEYRFSTADVIVIGSNDRMTFNTTMMSRFNTTVSDFSTTFEFPEGARFLGENFKSTNPFTTYEFSVKTDRNSFSLFRHPEFTIRATNFTSFDNNEFNIFFDYNRIWVVTPILSYTIVTLILLLAYAGFASKYGGRSSKKIEIVKEKIPVKELEDFHRVFVDYQSASNTLEKLRQDRRTKKINKREYDEQTKAVNKRLKALNIELGKVVKNAEGIPHKYFKLIQNTMNTFNKLQNTYVSIRENRKNYREKKITKSVYQNMAEEYLDQIDDLQAKVDRNLTSIEELIF